MENTIKNETYTIKYRKTKIIFINKDCPYRSKTTKISKIHLIGNIFDSILLKFIKIIKKITNILQTEQKNSNVKNNILIFKQDRLGDLAVTIPLLAVLKEKVPEYSVILITSPSNYELAKKIPYVDEIIVLNNKNLCINYIDMTKITKRVVSFYRFLRFDLKEYLKVLKKYSNSRYGIDLVGRRRNALVMKFLRTKKICGFKLSPFSFLYDFNIEYKEDENIILQFLKFLEVFGIKYNIDIDIKDIRLDNFKFKKQKIGKKIIGIHLGFGQEKCRNWGIENFLTLINMLSKRGYIIKIFYTNFEIKEFEQIYHKLYNKTNIKFIFCHNLDIFLKELEDVNIYVGIDGGPSHIVDVLGIPNIILFSRENPIKWGSFMSKSTIIKGIKNNCERRDCSMNVCIRYISPQIVFNEILNMMGELDGN